jgi:hypothetical protein
MWALLAAAFMLLLLPLMYRECDPDWTYPAIVIPLAGYLIYIAALWVSPFLNGLIGYNKNYLEGKKFVARFSAEEVRTSGEHLTWIHGWPSFYYIRETEQQFVFLRRHIDVHFGQALLHSKPARGVTRADQEQCSKRPLVADYECVIAAMCNRKNQSTTRRQIRQKDARLATGTPILLSFHSFQAAGFLRPVLPVDFSFTSTAPSFSTRTSS